MKRFIAPIFFMVISSGLFVLYVYPSYAVINEMMMQRDNINKLVDEAAVAKEKIDKLEKEIAILKYRLVCFENDV